MRCRWKTHLSLSTWMTRPLLSSPAASADEVEDAAAADVADDESENHPRFLTQVGHWIWPCWVNSSKFFRTDSKVIIGVEAASESLFRTDGEVGSERLDDRPPRDPSSSISSLIACDSSTSIKKQERENTKERKPLHEITVKDSGRVLRLFTLAGLEGKKVIFRALGSDKSSIFFFVILKAPISASTPRARRASIKQSGRGRQSSGRVFVCYQPSLKNSSDNPGRLFTFYSFQGCL